MPRQVLGLLLEEGTQSAVAISSRLDVCKLEGIDTRLDRKDIAFMKAIIGVVKNVDWKVCYIMYHTFFENYPLFSEKSRF